MDYIITIIFMGWVVLTLCAQMPKPRVLNYDYFHLLPVCRFFAPIPVTKDIVVYIKGIGANGIETNWRPLYFTDKKVWCFIWNPELRISKTINSLLRQLRPHINNTELVYLSSPYLSYLNAATSVYRPNPAITNVQFMITTFAGFEDATREIIFVSNVHRI